ncbi:MAG: family 1 extracellular solute-binding protein [Herbinix sp.]|jgi:raffinose/stachyose/melibiose transport system substrate-binding protein|nr:family 1 extracellular solute-binding protein [Herbinix sp.]
MKKMKKVLSVLLVFALVMSFTACAKNEGNAGTKTEDTSKDDATKAPTDAPDAPEATEPAANNPVTLTTVSMYGGTDPNAANYQAINEQFMKDYDYITIEDDSQSADQDWKTKIAADFAVGNEPDVIQYFTDANASDVLAADKFVTVDEIKAVYPEYAGDTLDSALAASSNPDGVSRAVPTTGYWEGLFVNKDLFDQYQLELPTDWDKLLKAIDVFKQNDIVPIAVSLNNVPHYWIEFLMLAAAGPDGYKSVPETAPEDWCKGLDLFKTLRDLGAFPVDTDTIDNDFAGEMFKNKQAAMQLDGSWYAGGIVDQDNTVLVSFPTVPGGKAEAGFIVGGISSGFYITKKAWEDPDKRDAAVKFVMAHTSSAAVQVYWNGNGQAAAAVTAVDNMTPLGISGMEYSQAATSISSPTDSRISQEAYNTLVAGIVDVSTGAKTSKELLDEVLALNAK